MSQSKQVDGINIVDLARIIALGECIGCGTHFKQKAYEDLVNFLDSTKPGVHKRAVIQIKARALEILGLWMLPNETNTSSHFHQMVQTEKDQQRGSTIDFKRISLNQASLIVRVFQQAAVMGGIYAHYYLGRTFEDDQKEERKQKGIYHLTRAADGGNAAAYFHLGTHFYEGDSVAKNINKAVALFQRSVELGYADAFWFLGALYINGRGVQEDKMKGIELLKRASDMGDTNAMSDIGSSYVHGIIVPANKRRGVELLEGAAGMGNTTAVFNLGTCFLNGDGVKQDKEKAYTFFPASGR